MSILVSIAPLLSFSLSANTLACPDHESLFSLQKFLASDSVALSFVCDKYCLIIN